MADQPDTRLASLRQLAEATGDLRLLDLVIATVEVLEQDTGLLLDQIHIARDLAARTKAGEWFGNTELTEIMSDADHFLLVYKRQREEIGRLKVELRDQRHRLDTAGET